jgi:hypothetical protein
VLYRTQRIPLLGLQLSLAYCPKGPALDWADGAVRRELLAELVRRARQAGAFLLKIDPEVPVSLAPAEEASDVSDTVADGGQVTSAPAPQSPSDLPGRSLISELQSAGWRRSTDRVQFDNTILLDLTPAEGQILAGMKQKTRYNIRLAQRHGVQVRPGGLEDLDLLMRMYAETSTRDGFAIRDPAYYRRAWEDFMGAGMAQPFIAEVEGEPVSGLIAYRFGATAWYLYGMSRSAHREKMPNHLLQWEAMRWASPAAAPLRPGGHPRPARPYGFLWGLYRSRWASAASCCERSARGTSHSGPAVGSTPVLPRCWRSCVPRPPPDAGRWSRALNRVRREAPLRQCFGYAHWRLKWPIHPHPEFASLTCLPPLSPCPACRRHWAGLSCGSSAMT